MFYLSFLIKAINEKIIKIIMFIPTILAPVGVEKRKETTIPTNTQKTDIIADKIITPLKLLHTLMAVKAGKITRLEISNAPIILIPSTIVIAVSRARSILYKFVLTPVAFAKFSSKVIAKIL